MGIPEQETVDAIRQYISTLPLEEIVKVREFCNGVNAMLAEFGPDIGRIGIALFGAEFQLESVRNERAKSVK